MFALASLLTRLVEYMNINREIPYEDAKKLYTVINSCTFTESISLETEMRLLREHPEDVEWTTEMFSWFSAVITRPMVTKEEVEGLEENSISEEKHKHILYWYPKLVPAFRAHQVLNSPKEYPGIRQDFPAVFEEYTPTLAEKTLLTIDTSSRFDTLCKTEKPEDVAAYFHKQLLLTARDVSFSMYDLDTTHAKLLEVKNSGISEERFLHYVDKNWKNNILSRVMYEFLTQSWTPHYLGVITDILSFHPKYKNVVYLTKKHGDYGRLASSPKLVRYLLNIPFEVEPSREFLVEKLDAALSDLIAFETQVILQNKKSTVRLIKDCGFPVENRVPPRVLGYPCSELVFSIADGKLKSYTRLESLLVDKDEHPVVYGQLALIDALSPVDTNILEQHGLNVLALIRYFSQPEFYAKKFKRHIETCTECKGESCGKPNEKTKELVNELGSAMSDFIKGIFKDGFDEKNKDSSKSESDDEKDEPDVSSDSECFDSESDDEKDEPESVELNLPSEQNLD